MKIDYQDRIDEYLLNRMSGEERTAFEQDVNHDEELQDQLSFTKDVQQTVIRRNEMIAKMKQWEEEAIGEEGDINVTEFRPTGSGYDYCPAPPIEGKRSTAHSSGRRIFYWLSGIAAVFIVGFFAFHEFYVAEQSNSDIFYGKMRDVPFEGRSTTFRAGSDNSELELMLSQKKYDEALDRINDEYLTLINDSIELAQDLTKDDEQKEYDFMIIKDKQDELKWLKAYTFLCMNQKDMALKVLNELRSTEGYYQMSADSLYNQIKNEVE